MTIFCLIIITLCAPAGIACASQEGGHGGSTLWPFIFSVINFILFLVVLYIFALPRIKSFFFERSEKIQQALKEAEEAKTLAGKQTKGIRKEDSPL